MKKLLILAAAPLLLAAAGPAAGSIASGTSSISVRYDDLDLATAQGQEKLQQRLASAVRTVCRPSGRLTLAEAENVNACSEAARAGAQRDLGFAIAAGRGRSQDLADAGISLALQRP
jgi:UrcA family protein